MKTQIAVSLIVITMMILASLMTAPAQAQEEGAHGGAPGAITGGPIPAGVTPDVTLETLPYLSFTPNPIGITQQLLVNMWVQPPLHVTRAHTGYTVTFTKPDGTKDVIGPVNSFTADTTYWFNYVPDQVGNWTVKFTFSGDYYPPGYYLNGLKYDTNVAGSTYFSQSVYYQGSSTKELPLVVQNDPIFSWPQSPLPTDYWTRPISMENREWWIIGGNDPFHGIGEGYLSWPADTNYYRNNYQFTPYVQGPTSSHIAWFKQGTLSGIFGGAIGNTMESAFTGYTGGSFTFGEAGPGINGNPDIVFEGRCYQTITKVAKTLVNGTYYDMPTSVWQCFDIRTGEVFWEQTGIPQPPTAISFQPNSPAVPGAVHRTGGVCSLVAVSSGRLLKYNPTTGAVTTNVSIAPLTSGTIYNDPYVLSVQTINATANNYRLINWTMDGTSTNFTSRIMSNVTWPFSSVGTADYQAGVAVTSQSISTTATQVSIGNRFIGVSLANGQVLWNVTTELVSGTQGSFSGTTAIADHGKYAIRLNDGLWHAYDLLTGQVAWVSKVTSYPWGVFGAYAKQSAYGLLFYNQYDGVTAYNWTNGQTVWQYKAPANPYETPYEGGYSWFSDGIVADGKLYTYTVEHSPTAPISRGFGLYCINATSGQLIWNITGSTNPGLVADGYLTASSYYDGRLYVFGKGLSKTTISAPGTAITQGQSLVITGTILDQSPAQPGTPCVSKESMTHWMEYLHMQHDIPADVTGVPISLDTVDPNGNSIHIATVTSDMSGTFNYLWKPDIPGKYVVTAAFAGDESYGSSWAETAVGVVEAPSASPTTAPANLDAVNNTVVTTVIAGVIAIIIAIAIIGLLILRKLNR